MSKKELEEELLSQIREAKLPSPERELRFHSVRRWLLDMAWPSVRLAVEVQGGIWLPNYGGRSRHTTGQGFMKDREKVNEASLLGWVVLELTSNAIKDGKGIDWIKRAYEMLMTQDEIHRDMVEENRSLRAELTMLESIFEEKDDE